MPDKKGITMSGQDIYSVDFKEFLPTALQHDSKMTALASAMADQLMAASGLAKNVLIYSRIDELPEALLDILAYDLHVDWYDDKYPLHIKRNILKNSVKVHKKMGTKYAVEKAISDVYPDSTIKEWFEYGGLPHHFKIILNMNGTEERVDTKRIEHEARLYKRLSSHLESIVLQKKKRTTIYSGNAKMVFVRVRKGPEEMDKRITQRIELNNAIITKTFVSAHYSRRGS